MAPGTNEERSVSFDPAFGQAAATPYGTVSFPISCNGAATDHFTYGLTLSPNRLNSLSGAGRSAELVGDWKRAGSYYGRVTVLLNDAESSAESSVPAGETGPL